jgi:hypothetical protein
MRSFSISSKPSPIGSLVPVLLVVGLALFGPTLSLGQSSLYGGSSLREDGTLTSPNGQYRMTLESADGSITLKRTNDNSLVWDSGVHWPNGHKYRLDMQMSDCNLVEVRSTKDPRQIITTLRWSNGGGSGIGSNAQCTLALVSLGPSAHRSCFLSFVSSFHTGWLPLVNGLMCRISWVSTL